MKTALVVPSNRRDGLAEFLAAWSPLPWDETVIVADQPEPMTGLTGTHLTCLSWADIDALGADGWIISRRDAAIRCLGFLAAARRGAEVIFTLDDDCHPAGDPGEFVRAHLRNLYATPAWTSSIPGMGVRGTPYDSDQHGFDIGVEVSMGLWRGVADLDAPRQLLRHPGWRDFEPPAEVRVMSDGQFFPLCGMNVAFRRSALPAMYFPLMGEGSPFHRFDDIWGGLTLQCALARSGGRVAVGEPFVHHRRASDPYRNLVREAPGIAANREVWRVLWPARDGGATDIASAMLDTARCLEAATGLPDLGSYFARWAQAIRTWLRLCSEC